MSLRVWLPLTKDLSNNGLSEYDIGMFRGTETYNANGKLGKCFYANGVNTIKVYKIIPDFYKYTGYSLCAWFYIEARNTVHSGSGIISAGNWNNQVLNLAVSDWSTDHYTKLRVSGTSWGYTYNYNFNLNTWYHAVVSSDGVKTYAYVNGTLIGDTVTGFLPSSIEGNDICIGGATYYNGMQFFGRINDVRIYDHALSPKEVSEIAKGLVCHYPLNDPNVTDNLILNGFGQDGLLGWSNSSYSTTEIPSVQPTIKASYTNNNQTTDYIPISHGTTYTISEYIKATSGATGNTYPSLLPYDVDKKFISNNNCLDGFNATYKTTLSQPLKKGDTVIHATDLSAWTTATTNHYYYVAIFGYKDSTGHVYADMTYTADSPSFGSMTDKSRIDKTNNTVTLLSAYTGEDRPAGTTICQATAGSSYVYPYGGIAVSTISDWTFKTATVNPSAHNRLKWARYVRYLAYPNAYHAGIKLISNTDDKIVYDSSGFSNNGKVEGTIFSSSDTPRNSIATKFNNPSGVFAHPNITFSQYTIAFWAKHSVAGKMLMGSCSSISSNNAWYWYGDNSFKYPSGEFYYAHNAGSAASLLGTWIHFVAVYDGANITVYRNGVNEGSKSATGSMLLEYLSIGFGYSTAFSEDGYVSDFRVYATALSADDVKKLYNTPESIANNGSVLTQGEFVEV